MEKTFRFRVLVIAVMLCCASCAGPPAIVSDAEREKAYGEEVQAAKDLQATEIAAEKEKEKSASDAKSPSERSPGERKRELITGKIVSLDRPNVSILIYSEFQPVKGDKFTVYRQSRPVGQVEITGEGDKRWHGKITYEVENQHVYKEDRIIGPIE